MTIYIGHNGAMIYQMSIQICRLKTFYFKGFYLLLLFYIYFTYFTFTY